MVAGDFLLYYWGRRPPQDIKLFISAAVAMAEWQATGASPSAALKQIDLTVREMVTLALREVEGGVAMF